MSNLSFDFSDQCVIVTGAARGIGLAIASFFKDAKATVYMVDMDHAQVDAAAKTIGAIGIAADVSSTTDVERVVAQVIADSGRIDVLVNNAGILRDGVVWKFSDEDWESVLAVHLGGTFRFTRACTPHFRERNFGRIINVTSYTGIRGNVGQANYGAAKAGIIGLTKTTAKELARFGITVNAISPNAATRMIDSIPDDKKAELAAAIPISLWGEPAEMCPAIGFLASAEASYITGVVLPVDGGLSM